MKFSSILNHIISEVVIFSRALIGYFFTYAPTNILVFHKIKFQINLKALFLEYLINFNYFEDLKMNKKFKNLNQKIAEFITHITVDYA